MNIAQQTSRSGASTAVFPTRVVPSSESGFKVDPYNQPHLPLAHQQHPPMWPQAALHRTSSSNARRPNPGHTSSWHFQRQHLRAPSNEPRPLAELHNERAYLMESLQRQDDRARRLLSSLSAAQEELPRAQTTGEARRFRREVSKLKARIADSAHQERTTALRLSELYIELQSRERLSQVQYQRSTPAVVPPYIPPPMVLTAAGWLNGQGSPGLASPWSPSAVWRPLSPMNAPTAPGPSYVENPWEVPTVRVVDGWNHGACFAPNQEPEIKSPKLKFAFVEEEEEDDVKAWKGHVRSLSLNATYMPQPRDKRMSLPSLRTFWPQTVEED